MNIIINTERSQPCLSASLGITDSSSFSYAKTNSMRLILSVLLLVLSVVFAGDTFVVNCAPLTIQRADPIVTPGKPSQHVHAIVGGNAFRRTMSDANSAELATATTCDKKLDHSNYWVPHLYHKDSQGRYSLVPWTGTVKIKFEMNIGLMSKGHLLPK